MSNTSTFTVSNRTKKEWLKRLRSGNYKQTDSELYNVTHNAYCCLGVLCEIEGKSADEIKGLGFPHDAGVCERMTYDELCDLLGEETLDRVMLEHCCDVPDLTYAIKTKQYGWVPLSVLNDNKRMSFVGIADLIEKYVETH